LRKKKDVLVDLRCGAGLHAKLFARFGTILKVSDTSHIASFVFFSELADIFTSNNKPREE
jgi:hypothetical protein